MLACDGDREDELDIEPGIDSDLAQADGGPSEPGDDIADEAVDLVQVDVPLDSERDDIPDEQIRPDEQLSPLVEAQDEPVGSLDLTEDIPDYDLQAFFDRHENPIATTHVYANVPKTRTGRVTRKPKYLSDYSQ